MLFYLVALGLLVLDFLSKLAVRLTLPLGQPVPVIPGVFYLTYLRNPGAAFGLFPGRVQIFVIVSVLAMIVLMVANQRLRPPVLVQAALGLQLGGVWGNLIDRVTSGLVTDFLDFRIWPVFNLADSGIVVGAVVLAWWAMRGGHPA